MATMIARQLFAALHWRKKMNDRYIVISPDTLEAMRRAVHVAKLEARIEKLEAAMRKIDRSSCLNPHDICDIARKALDGKDD
jgi:DNA-binding transcriptional regulator LsrR (DeoR family)